MAKKCDRCGGYFDPYTEPEEFGRINGFVTQNCNDFRNNEVQYRDEEIDLCPWCLAGFVRFLAGEPAILGLTEEARKRRKAHNEKDDGV